MTDQDNELTPIGGPTRIPCERCGEPTHVTHVSGDPVICPKCEDNELTAEQAADSLRKSIQSASDCPCFQMGRSCDCRDQCEWMALNSDCANLIEQQAAELEALKHDIARHLNITSEQAARIAELLDDSTLAEALDENERLKARIDAALAVCETYEDEYNAYEGQARAAFFISAILRGEQESTEDNQ